MSQSISLLATLFFLIFFSACSYFQQDTSNPEMRTASHERVAKTVTEQSPAFMRAAPPSEESLKMQIDGTWQDADDSKHMFVIAGEDYIELYEGRQVSKMKFDLYNACPNDKGEIDENGGFIWLQTAIDTSCYEIRDLSPNSMVLMDMAEGKQIRCEKK